MANREMSAAHCTAQRRPPARRFPHGALKVLRFIARFIYAEKPGLSSVFTLAPPRPFH